jgi:hypothetical protein
VNRPLVIWFGVGVLYLVFFTWYTGAGEPLTPDEVDAFIERLRAADRDPERLAEFRELLEADTGEDLVIVNAILLHEQPLRVGEVGPDESSSEVLGRYMAYMWPALLSRACHPVIGGNAGIAVEVWGVDGAADWSSAGLMRYRSLRDMLEIATDPAFRDAHQYKVAAMAKTIAFPIDAYFNLGEPRLLLGLFAFSLAAALHLLVGRPAAAG